MRTFISEEGVSGRQVFNRKKVRKVFNVR